MIGTLTASPTTKFASRCGASLIAAELDALGERKLGGKINRVRLAPHIALPRVTATFPSPARIFFSAERAADFGAACSGIHIGDAAIASEGAHEFFRLPDVVREDGGGQPLRDSVLNGQSFVKIAIGHEIKQGPES